jgi:hypothetical protein
VARLPFFSSAGVSHRGDHADLLQESQNVFFCPFFGELAVGDPVDCNRRHLHVIASPRGAGQVALVLSKRSEAGHYFVPFGNLIFNAMISRSGNLEELERLLQSLAAGVQTRERRRVVVKVVYRHQFIQRVYIALVDLRDN